ncbi:MAG: PAS domain S-box protein [Candidatus Lokiarchaeota archaeon]|nr:PAS domain S-box protein [Candidatus Lokiarchaeota archaeon]
MLKDEEKTKDQLIDEIKFLQKQLKENKSIENIIFENEKQLRYFFEHHPDYLIILDINGKINYANRIFSHLNWEDVIGHYLKEFFLPESHQEYDEKLAEIFQTGQTSSMTTKGFGPNRIIIWYECRFTPIKENQKIIGVILIARNINEKKETEEKLIRIMKAFQSTSDAIGISDPKGKHFFQNESFTKLFEYTAEELQGAGGGPAAYFDNTVGQKVFGEITSGRSWSGEVEMISKSGRRFPVFLRADAIKNEKGEIIDLIGVHTDISNRKKAELKLKESEERYRLITENAQDLIAIINKRNRYEFINERSYLRVLGYKKEDMIDKRTDYFIHPDDLNNYANSIIETVVKGEGSLIARYRHKDGHYRWMDTYGKIFYDDKRDSKVLVFGKDITEQLETERRIKESEEKFRMMAEHSLIGILIFQDGKIKYANKMTSEIGEYSIEEMMNWEPNKIFDFMHPEDKIKILDEVQDVFKGLIKTPARRTYRFITKSGNMKWIEVFSKMINFEGKLALFSSILDITSKKEVERELQESKEKYQEAYNRSEFLKDVFAHDINNILQNILSSSEITSLYLNNPEKRGDALTILNIIREQIKRGSKLVTNVQKLSRMDENEEPLVPIEIIKVLNEAISHITHNLEEKTFDIQVDSSEKEFLINANELLIDIFENLIFNSLKHNKNYIKKIRIRIHREEIYNSKFVRMEFKDNGLGIEDVRKREIFLRGSGGSLGHTGMGLGLYLVKRIIKFYDGKIWVEDNLMGDYTKGSNFIILFPEI